MNLVDLTPHEGPAAMPLMVALARMRTPSADAAPALPTGFDPLDHVLEGGLRPEELMIVGGAPGVGKTVLTLQVARNLACAGHPVVFVSYEHGSTALAARLLLLEVGELGAGDDAPTGGGLRGMVRSLVTGSRTLDDVVAGNPALGAALSRMSSYGERLGIIRASARTTGLAQLDDAVAAAGDPPPVLVVDYLQKVAGFDDDPDGMRVRRIATGLKEMALQRGMPVITVVAATGAGLETRRLRLHHLSGATALAYEADVAALLNEKYRAVSKVHSAYDPVRAETFRRHVVVSIEKNRDGPARLDLEFAKDFEHYRFRTRGAFTADQLIDEHFYPE